ncbi:MAG: DNA primase, partial [Candidatus Margulisbacteria bacterium]|nr:DNA primase [Candidatus Margulisiibacteriota bacterium]
FTVSPEKQIFHCFGCNEGGNAFAFLMKMENIGFAEAVAELGNKLGIAVPRPASSGPAKDLKDKLYKITELAAEYFQKNLADESGETARAYLDQRGINAKTVAQFRLGYAPQGWDNLFNYLVSRGADPTLIEKTGLSLKREGKGGYYDRFRNRLIFPVSNQRGRVEAFGGRALGNEEPKYLNSPDTGIYHKGETLFGLDLSKEAIKQTQTAILVEGNFDLITPFQAGITNIVASMGTALTAYQCKLIARYCDTIVLTFDADSAGGIAADRSIDLLRNQGLRVKVTQLTGGKDPDEVIQKKGAEALRKCLSDAQPYLEFQINRVFARHDLKEIESRSKALKEVAIILAKEKDDFVRKEYAKVAAASLRTEVETVIAEIKRNRSYPSSHTANLQRTTEKPASKIVEAEKHLIACAAQSTQALNFIKERLNAQDFHQPETSAIAALLFSTDFAGQDNPAHFLLDNLPDESSKKYLSRILVSGNSLEQNKMEEILNDCLSVLKNERLRLKIEEMKLEITEAEKAGNPDRAAELLSALKTEIS